VLLLPSIIGAIIIADGDGHVNDAGVVGGGCRRGMMKS